MSPAIDGLHHAAVAVRSLSRAAWFYGEVLGLAVEREHRRADGTLRSIWFTLAGASFLAVEEVTGGPVRTDEAPGWHCLVLRIQEAEREAWRERLHAHGIAVERESDYTLYARDPEGALIGLSHHPEPAVR